MLSTTYKICQSLSSSTSSRTITTAKRMASTQETIWSLGYGSNMDVKALEAKKHVKVLGKQIFFPAIKKS